MTRAELIAMRDGGATWQAIGDAMGLTRQGARYAYVQAVRARRMGVPDASGWLMGLMDREGLADVQALGVWLLADSWQDRLASAKRCGPDTYIEACHAAGVPVPKELWERVK